MASRVDTLLSHAIKSRNEAAELMLGGGTEQAAPLVLGAILDALLVHALVARLDALNSRRFRVKFGTLIDGGLLPALERVLPPADAPRAPLPPEGAMLELDLEEAAAWHELLESAHAAALSLDPGHVARTRVVDALATLTSLGVDAPSFRVVTPSPEKETPQHGRTV
ncbi:MAG TPA: hypothetical protein VEW68_05425 [Patescibacteria group bacterium]|nr:hypothetical protein [Patescibacteria group bacterium]